MRTISLSLPEELLIELDEAAKEEWRSRSEYIRRALIDAVTNRQKKKDFKAVEKLRRDSPFDPRLYDLDDS